MRSLTTLLPITLLVLAPATAFGGDVKISGFVDSSATIPLAKPPVHGRSKTAIGLDQVELDFESKVSDYLTVRVDVDIFGGSSGLEQGFLKYNAPGTDFWVQAGRINAPIGAEAQDPVDMYQFSNGLLFTNATPANYTGASAGMDGGMWEGQLIVLNGKFGAPKTENDYGLGARFDYKLDEESHVGVVVLYGSLQQAIDDAKNGKPTMLVDADLKYALGNTTIFGEVAFTDNGAETGLGFMGKVNQKINEEFSATGRFGSIDHSKIGGPKMMSGTAALLVAVGEGLGAVVEVRADMPDGGDTAIGAAIELTGAF